MHRVPPRDASSGSWAANGQGLGFILIVPHAGEEPAIGEGSGAPRSQNQAGALTGETGSWTWRFSSEKIPSGSRTLSCLCLQLLCTDRNAGIRSAAELGGAQPLAAVSLSPLRCLSLQLRVRPLEPCHPSSLETTRNVPGFPPEATEISQAFKLQVSPPHPRPGAGDCCE